MNTLTCHTDGCVNQDIPVQLELEVVDPNDGTVSYVDGVTCGWCRAPITDVVPRFTPGAPV